MDKHFNTSLKLKIDWADLDLFGHVNNVVYFRYIQSARVNYCELIGLTSLDVPDKLGFMVASSQCQFKKPLHYPAEINVCARVDWAKNSSFQISYKIEKGEQLIAEGMDVIVVFDHRKKTKVTIPGSVRQKMEDIEKRILNLPD